VKPITGIKNWRNDPANRLDGDDADPIAQALRDP
jgi:hypothetical protein